MIAKRLLRHPVQQPFFSGEKPMYKYAISISVATLLSLTATLLFAGQPLDLSYQYQAKTGVNLATIRGGPLFVGEFTDQRNDGDLQDIQRPDREPITLTGLSPAALVQSAVTGAFTSSGAMPGNNESQLILNGKLIEMSVKDTGSGLEVLIRCELTLINQGRNAWQSVVFSRTAVESKDISLAIGQGLDRLVAELFRDDYFLMELGIF
jgi:hypothetical protein